MRAQITAQQREALVKANRARAVPLAERFWRYVSKGRGCWIWSGARNNKGYGTLNVRDTPAYAHRISWEVNFGAVPDGQRVLHRCDNPACVRPEHLFLGTQLDNVRDMDRKGRRINAGQKLSPEDIASAQRQRAAGVTQAAIARALGVHQTTVSRLFRSGS